MKTLLGYITKPQGIKGEFRLRPEFLDADTLKNLKNVEIKNQNHAVKKVVLREGFIILEVEGITDRNLAETLRNETVYFDYDDTLNEGEFYINDLIGCSIVSTNRNIELGKLIEINKFGAADVYTVKTEKGEFMFPFARNVITNVDVNNHIIYVDEIILNEIKC